MNQENDENQVPPPPNSEEDSPPVNGDEEQRAEVDQEQDEPERDTVPSKTCQRCSKPRDKVFELTTCKHEVCKRCLPADIANAMDSEADDESTLELAEADCPLCQKQTIFQEDDVTSYPPSFQNFLPVKEVFDLEHVHKCGNCAEVSGTETDATGRCIDCRLYICEACSAPGQHGEGPRHRIFTLDEIKSGGSFEDVSVIPKVDPTHCNVHKGCKIERWCCTCATGLCETCLRQHREHIVFELSFYMKEMEGYIKRENERTEQVRDSLSQAVGDSQKSKETRMQEFQNMAENIQAIADARKQRIDEDAEALLLQLKTLQDVYENETGNCESKVVKKNTVLSALQRIHQTLLGNGSVTDDRVIRMYQFLKANEHTIDNELREISNLSHDVRSKAGRKWNFDENVPLMISGGDNVLGKVFEQEQLQPIFKTLVPKSRSTAEDLIMYQRPIQDRPSTPLRSPRSPRTSMPLRRQKDPIASSSPRPAQSPVRLIEDDDLRRSYTIIPAPSSRSPEPKAKGRKGQKSGVSPKSSRRSKQDDTLRSSYTVSIPRNVTKARKAEDDNHTVFLKVLILGDQVVGKTRLLHKLMHMEEDKDPRATLGLDCGARKLIVGEDLVMFSLWELAGKESYRESLSLYTKDIQMLIIVYDVARRKTFDNAELWLREARKSVPERIPIMLVGNTELIHNHPEWIRRRQVDILEAEDWAARHGLYFAEMSVRDSSKKLEKTFRRTMQEILKMEFGTSGTRQLDYLGRKCRMSAAREDSVCRVQ